MFSRDCSGPVQSFGQVFVKDLVYQGTLARARNAGNNGHDPQRDLHVDILEVVDARAAHLDPSGGLPAVFRYRNGLLPAQILPRDGLGNRHDLLCGALRHYLAPVGACARPDVHDVVRRQHGVLVVFYHDDRIPQISQVLEGPQKLVVVSLVQADTRLVQNIAHSHQSRTDLGRQPDSLGLSAGQRRCRPRQCQIIQSHVDQKAHSGLDLLEDLMADLLLSGRQLQIVQEILQRPDGHAGEVVNIDAAHCDCQRFLAQALPAAGSARCNAHEGLVFRFHRIGCCLAVALLRVPDQSVESNGIDALSSLSLVVDVDTLIRAVHEHLLHFGLKIFVRRIHAEAEFLCQGLKDRVGEASLVHAGLPSEHSDRALIDGSGLIGDDQLRGEFHPVAETRADRAGSERIVEGEAPRLDLRHADAAVRAGKTLGELHQLSVYDVHLQKAVRQLQRVLHGIRKSSLNAFLHHKAVDDHLDIVLDILLQLDILGHVIEIPVDAQAHIAGLSRPVDNLLVFALSAADHRREDLDPGALRQFHDAVHHLVHRLPCDLSAAVRAMGNADPGVQKSEIVINLRHSPHRRPGVPVGRLLVNGDRGGQSLDLLHIRLLHLSQELSCVGRQGLHISPLPLGIDRVKSQRRLARTRQPGQNYQLIARDLQRQVLEIVLIGAPDADAVFFINDAPSLGIALSLDPGQSLSLFEGGPVIRFFHLHSHAFTIRFYGKLINILTNRSVPAHF